MLASDIDTLAAFATTAEESLHEIRASGKIDPHTPLGQAFATAHTAVDNLLGAFNRQIREHQCAVFGCEEVAAEDDMYQCSHCGQWVCGDHSDEDGEGHIICRDCYESFEEYRDIARQVAAANDEEIAAINKGR